MKKPKRIKAISDKRRKIMREYGKLKRAFLARHPMCEVFPWNRATQIHHTRGRAGSLLLDTRYWMAVSFLGHRFIHDFPARAKSVGWIGPWGRTEP